MFSMVTTVPIFIT